VRKNMISMQHLWVMTHYCDEIPTIEDFLNMCHRGFIVHNFLYGCAPLRILLYTIDTLRLHIFLMYNLST
jgi:hypothetical protein